MADVVLITLTSLLAFTEFFLLFLPHSLSPLLLSWNTKVYPRALVVINPGNPTGTQLAASQLASLLSLCHKERLTVLADEV